MTSYISENFEFSDTESASALKIDNILTTIVKKFEEDNTIPYFNTEYDKFSIEDIYTIRSFISAIWEGHHCWINSENEIN